MLLLSSASHARHLRTRCIFRRLHDNQFVCDCRLLWLAKYLKLHPFLGLNARCQDADTRAYKDIVSLIDDEKQCSSMGTLLRRHAYD